MGKRGPKPKNNISTMWSPELAYTVGLLVSDGCLYNNGRHISLTTKDIDQAKNFKKCLGLDVKIGIKNRGSYPKTKCYHVQFGSVIFYEFLLSIGLTPAKSKTIGEIAIPERYFMDYLRGYFDGDGTFYSYWDPRWKSSHMFYIAFACGSINHLYWLQKSLYQLLNIKGHVTKMGKTDNYQLRYAKRESLEIISKMYYTLDIICLMRKKDKIFNALKVEKVQQDKY